jgi:hypothetical protein
LITIQLSNPNENKEEKKAYADNINVAKIMGRVRDLLNIQAGYALHQVNLSSFYKFSLMQLSFFTYYSKCNSDQVLLKKKYLNLMFQ